MWEMRTGGPSLATGLWHSMSSGRLWRRALCILECHPDRSGRFPDSYLAPPPHPPSQKSLSRGRGSHLARRSWVFLHTSDRPPHSQTDSKVKEADHTQGWASQDLLWDIALALSLCPGLRVLLGACPEGPQPVGGSENQELRTQDRAGPKGALREGQIG